MHLGNLLNLGFLHLLRSPLSLLLSHPYLLGPNKLIRRRRESRKARKWRRLGDLTPLVKRRFNKLRSSKKLARYHTEVWKRQILNLQSLRLGSQHQCLVVSPWWTTHQLEISMGVLGAMSPRPWSRLCCFLRIWLSYEVKEKWGFPQCQKIFGHGMMLTLGCCRFVFVVFFFFKKIYNYHIYILLICYGTDHFLLGYLSHFQAWRDNQLLLPAVGWWKKKEAYNCANINCCWTKQRKWRRNWPTRSILEKVLMWLWRVHKDRPRLKGDSCARPMTSWLLPRSNWQLWGSNWKKLKSSKIRLRKRRLRRRRQRSRLRRKRIRPNSMAMTSAWLRLRTPSGQRFPPYAKPTVLRLRKKPSTELGLRLFLSWESQKMSSSLQP